MRVAISGATGFVGSRVARAAAGHADVQALSLIRPGRSGAGGSALVRHVELDSAAQVLAALSDVDVVVHAAADLSGGTRSDEANVTITRAVVDAVRQRGIRMVHLSTTSVYDLVVAADVVTEAAPLLTTDSPDPVASSAARAYAWSKVLAEREVARLANAVVLRPAAVLGDGPTSTWGRRVPSAIAAGTWISPHPDTTMGWVHVDDLAAACLAAATTAMTGPINIVGGHTTFGTWVRAIGHAQPRHLEGSWHGTYDVSRLATLGVAPTTDLRRALERP